MSFDDPTPLPQHGLDADSVSRDAVARPVGGHEAEHHVLASLFPLLEGRAFLDLCEDIAQHGLREPIVLYENQVLDGRNRQRACAATSTPPVFREWEGADPLAFVVSANLKRRHLDEAQRAAVGARLATMPAWRPAGSRSIDLLTQDEVAEKLNVSVKSIKRARQAIDSGIPELVAALDQGEVAVSAAAEISALPKKSQRRVMNKVKHGEKPSKALKHVIKEGGT